MSEAILGANEELVHGFTYSGHPVASAVALKNLEVMEREKIVERVERDVGPYLQSRLRERFQSHKLVGEVRGVGMLAAIELVRDRRNRVFFDELGAVGTICRNYCFNNDLICRAIRDTMVLAPPLVIRKEEIDEIILRLGDAIDRTAADLGV
jgi:putrescine aminotransferase